MICKMQYKQSTKQSNLTHYSIAIVYNEKYLPLKFKFLNNDSIEKQF